MNKSEKYIPGLKAAIETIEWRKKANSYSDGLCKTNESFIAGMDEILICLRASLERAEKGEDIHPVTYIT